MALLASTVPSVFKVLSVQPTAHYSPETEHRRVKAFGHVRTIYFLLNPWLIEIYHHPGRLLQAAKNLTLCRRAFP
jgi:hypothetical protein